MGDVPQVCKHFILTAYSSALTRSSRRHADRTGQLWLQRLKDSGSNKRLNLIYLANGMNIFPADHYGTSSMKLPDFNVSASLLMASSIIEVAQQSKARRKDDFLIAFSPIIAEATATAYKGATNEVQGKLRRVVEVWRARQIFDLSIQGAIEARIDGRSHIPVLGTMLTGGRT